MKNADRRYLGIALALLLGFMGVEVAIGVMAGSLALILSRPHTHRCRRDRPGAVGDEPRATTGGGSYTFGLKRAEILSAQFNGLSLLLLRPGLSWKRSPADLATEGGWPAGDGGGVVGIGVNLVAAWVMSKANRQSLNVEGSFQHILTDLYAFIATAVAGAIVWWTGWNRVDSIAALVVAGLMFKAGFGLVRDSGRVFLEAAPRGLDPATIDEAMQAIAGVNAVEDLHVWEVTRACRHCRRTCSCVPTWIATTPAGWCRRC